MHSIAIQSTQYNANIREYKYTNMHEYKYTNVQVYKGATTWPALCTQLQYNAECRHVCCETPQSKTQLQYTLYFNAKDYTAVQHNFVEWTGVRFLCALCCVSKPPDSQPSIQNKLRLFSTTQNISQLEVWEDLLLAWSDHHHRHHGSSSSSSPSWSTFQCSIWRPPRQLSIKPNL